MRYLTVLGIFGGLAAASICSADWTLFSSYDSGWVNERSNAQNGLADAPGVVGINAIITFTYSPSTYTPSCFGSAIQSPPNWGSAVATLYSGPTSASVNDTVTVNDPLATSATQYITFQDRVQSETWVFDPNTQASRENHTYQGIATYYLVLGYSQGGGGGGGQGV